MTQRQIYYSAILLFIAILTGSLLYYAEQPSSPVPHFDTNLPESYAQNVSIIRYDATGALASTMFTPRAVHYTNDNSTQFFKPRIILFDKTQEPWQISAERGTTHQGFDVIDLQNNVYLHQPAGKQNNDITIASNLLTLNNTKQTAYTNQPVTMTEKANTTNNVITVKSVGVYAEQKTGVVKLLSHAQGLFLPGKKTT